MKWCMKQSSLQKYPVGAMFYFALLCQYWQDYARISQKITNYRKTGLHGPTRVGFCNNLFLGFKPFLVPSPAFTEYFHVCSVFQDKCFKFLKNFEMTPNVFCYKLTIFTHNNLAQKWHSFTHKFDTIVSDY